MPLSGQVRPLSSTYSSYLCLPPGARSHCFLRACFDTCTTKVQPYTKPNNVANVTRSRLQQKMMIGDCNGDCKSGRQGQTHTTIVYMGSFESSLGVHVPSAHRNLLYVLQGLVTDPHIGDLAKQWCWQAKLFAWRDTQSRSSHPVVGVEDVYAMVRVSCFMQLQKHSHDLWQLFILG